MTVGTETILEHSLEMASQVGAGALVVYAEAFPDREALQRFLERAGEVRVVLVAREHAECYDDLPVEVVGVPDTKLTRIGQIKVAVVLGLSRGVFRQGDRLVCLTGIAGTGALDTIVLMEVGEEFEMFASVGASDISREVRPDVLQKVLDIAISLGTEGREGKPVGTTFVIGDTERVLEHSHQMILNPFRGYGEEERNLFLEGVEETVKELSAIDGAFVVRSDGLVEAAGVFLETGGQNVEVPRGLGARHQSAAAITAMTDAVAVTASESSGNVTVFRDGKVVVEIEKPRPIGREMPRRRQFFGEQTAGIDYAPDAQLHQEQ